jgi:dsRNA-specific ribonuclease
MNNKSNCSKYSSRSNQEKQPGSPKLFPLSQYNDDDIFIEKSTKGDDQYIFDPYNPLNHEISQQDIETILREYGITTPITNFTLYKRAFIHRSYIKRPDIENEQNNIIIIPKPDICMPLFTKSNERLEFVGDGVLECITKYYLYRRFPKENEGFMTEKKIALVKNEAIGKMAMEMGLHKWFVISKHSEMKQTRTNLKKLGCLFEAFIGAMFLDFNKIIVKDEEHWFDNVFLTGPGFQMVQIFIENVFEKHVDWTHLIQNDDNYKNILQVKLQKEFKTTPYYIEMEEYNADTGYHMGVYLCLGQFIYETGNVKTAVHYSLFRSYQDIHRYISENDGKIFMFLGEGLHKIKKKAEQSACFEATKRFDSFAI